MIKKRQKGLYYSFVELLSMSFNFNLTFLLKECTESELFVLRGIEFHKIAPINFMDLLPYWLVFIDSILIQYIYIYYH